MVLSKPLVFKELSKYNNNKKAAPAIAAKVLSKLYPKTL